MTTPTTMTTIVKKKVNKGDIIENKLISFNALQKTRESELADLRIKQRYRDRAYDDAYYDLQEVKQSYKRAQKERKIVDDNIKKQKKLLLYAEINASNLKIQQTLLQTKEEERQTKKTEKKVPKGQKSEPILNKVELLPEALVQIIGSYLTYEVRNKLLEKSYGSIRKYLTGLNGLIVNRFLLNFYRDPEALKTYDSVEEALASVKWITPNALNPKYKRIPQLTTLNRSDMYNYILYMIDQAKKKNPKFAYSIMSKIYILINPKKKYRTLYDPPIRRELYIRDFPKGTEFPEDMKRWMARVNIL